MDFTREYQRYKGIFEDYLNDELNKLSGHKTLIDSMKYSFNAGGKRVRPVLMLSVAEMLGGDVNKVLPFAFSLECIHTYSLIHDDLPCMDDDDLRRNMPTNHKVFGENFAVLAGDALLNLAMEHSINHCTDKNDISALKYMFACSGYKGMILGQAHDVLPVIEDKKQHLFVTDINKTAKLLSVALCLPAILYGKDAKDLEKLAKNLGLIYQYVDDLLDETGDEKSLGKAVGKDRDKNKFSATVVFGTDNLKKELDKLYNESLKLINSMQNGEFLEQFLKYSVKRVS
ncbi:MAG: polyprenyl synthetase family protein [Christensenellaceae bacterium]